jgi:hypothetical protein
MTRKTVGIVAVSVLLALLVGGAIAETVGRNSAGNSGDTHVTTPKEGERREWTPERMRSASPEPMPKIP